MLKLIIVEIVFGVIVLTPLFTSSLVLKKYGKSPLKRYIFNYSNMSFLIDAETNILQTFLPLLNFLEGDSYNMLLLEEVTQWIDIEGDKITYSLKLTFTDGTIKLKLPSESEWDNCFHWIKKRYNLKLIGLSETIINVQSAEQIVTITQNGSNSIGIQNKY